MSYLNDFLFSPERANSPVRTLSGGERNRVLLARLFALPANVLVLDEPTNDLDIDTLELLEELLQSYAGTVFLVSHDRRFLDNVVTSTIAWEGDEQPGPLARVRRRLRGLEGAARARARRCASRRPKRCGRARQGRSVAGAGAGSAAPCAAAPKPRKLSYKEQREFDGAARPHRRARSRAEGARRAARRCRVLREGAGPRGRRADAPCADRCRADCARSSAGRSSAAAPRRRRRRVVRMNFQQLRAVREAIRRDFNLTEVAKVLHTSQPGDQPADPRARGRARRRPVRARRQAPDRHHRGRRA